MLIMEIPNKIKMGGYTIQVEQVHDLMNDRQELGVYYPRTQTINMDADCTDQLKDEILIHELLEAIKFHYNLELEHHELSIISTVLHQVLRDNKLVF